MRTTMKSMATIIHGFMPDFSAAISISFSTYNVEMSLYFVWSAEFLYLILDILYRMVNRIHKSKTNVVFQISNSM